MILYHYCRPDAFLAIMQQKKIWLSSSSDMSDYLEGSWIVGIINEALADLASKYSEQAINNVVDIYNRSKFSPYICCFSEDGDLLSQWRGYACDGRGFAIGFDSSFFPATQGIPRMANFGGDQKKNLFLAKIEYDFEEQKNHVETLLEFALRHLENEGEINTALVFEQSEYLADVSVKMGFDRPLPYSCGSLSDVMEWLVGYATITKNPAFREEHEYRLVHAPLIIGCKTTNRTIQSLHEISEPRYRATDSKICPYYEFDFSSYFKDGIVSEVILGPKNETSHSTLRAFFGRTEKPDIQIKQSGASYR